MLACVLLALVAFASLSWPKGPIRPTEKRITVLDGINSIAWVAGEDGRIVRVHLPMRHNCHVGDRVQLTERRTLWGLDTKVALVPQPCAP